MMMTATIEAGRRLLDKVDDVDDPVLPEPATETRLEVECAPRCRCGRAAEPYVDDPDRRMSSHRTAEGHVVYYRCECGHPRFAHLRWTAR